MLAVAQSSTLDRYSNNFSLFHLLEQMRPAAYPARLSVFSHAFFETDAGEVGVEHQVRLVLVHGGRTIFESDPVTFKPTGERHRVRIAGLTFPEPGLYRVMVEWRTVAGPVEEGEGREPQGQVWNREAAAWPIRADVPLQ